MKQKLSLTMEIDNEKVKSVALYLLAFFLPVVLLIAIFVKLELYPLSEIIYVPVDAYGQYVPFFTYFRNIFFQGSSIFYSLGKSLGGEVFGIFAYYLTSPYNLITLLFNKENIILAYDIILIIKMASSSVSMVYYLNRRKKAKFSNLIFGIMYSMSAYVITYGFNIMWLDGVILLPIIISRIDDLIEDRKVALYIVSLSLALIINYYVGFMICIFVAFYFLYKIIIQTKFKRIRLFKKFHKKHEEDETEKLDLPEVCSKKNSLKTFGIFAFSSICAALIAGFILIPVFFGLQNGKADFSFSNINLEKNFDITKFISKFFTNAFEIDEIKNVSMPPVFCGVLANILVVLYFLNGKISLKEKIFSILILGMFFVSFYINGANLLWSMGHRPAWYEYRYGFMFSLFYIMIAAKRI